MKRYILLIDGHNFLMRCLYGSSTNKGGVLLKSKTSKENYIERLIGDFSHCVNSLNGCVSRVVFAEDSHSWRKSIGEVEYKANRAERQEMIDWAGFDECFGVFKETLLSWGVTFSKWNDAEADDLLFYWTTSLARKSKSVIIYSTDKDMLQLIRPYDNNVVLLYDSMKKKMYVPSGTKEEIMTKKQQEVQDIFNLSKVEMDTYDNLRTFIKGNNVEVEEVDADKCVVMKVMCGDRSDNIPSIYSYTKNGRTFNLTELKAESILNIFKEKNGCPFTQDMLYNDNALHSLAQCTQEVLKKEVNEKTLVWNLKRNTRYISLDMRSLPQEVFEGMSKSVNECVLQNIDTFKMNSQMEKKDVKASIFKSLDDKDDMSFINDPLFGLFKI